MQKQKITHSRCCSPRARLASGADVVTDFMSIEVILLRVGWVVVWVGALPKDVNPAYLERILNPSLEFNFTVLVPKRTVSKRQSISFLFSVMRV